MSAYDIPLYKLYIVVYIVKVCSKTVGVEQKYLHNIFGHHANKRQE